MGSGDRRKFSFSFWKMDTTIWLSIATAIIILATPTSSSEPRVVCYYTNWSVYRPGTARFNPQNINPYLCTHLIYAFGGFTKDNTLKPFDKYQDIEKGGYAKFNGLKTYNKQLKTLLAIGGWNEGSSRFSPMVAARDKRKEFVRNVIKFLRQNHFDGLDLDWEYPAFRDGSKPKDRENYAKLVKELREEFDRESEKTGKPRLLLTMAVPAGIEYIQKGFDVKTLNQYLDWMNLLTYDYHSAFEPAVNHHAPLYPLEEQNEYSVDNELNIDYTIKFYLENGADRDKLVLGIPTYGRSYTLFNPDATEIGSPADGPGEQGDATREKGYLAYYEICESLKPKEKKKRATADDDSDEEDEDEEEEEEEEKPWTVVQPNPKAMGPVAYRGNQWVGYDDVDIVKKKAAYVAENGLGGIMFWSIDNDDFRGTCHGKPYPLIEAAKESYIQRLGSTDNTVVSDRPRSLSSTVRSSNNRRKNRPRTTTTTTTERSSVKRKSGTSTTPSWSIITPEPPTTPDPGSDFKCKDEGFFPHPRDCKKYFWCLDSGPSNLGIVAHAFTCPSGLFFNKAADSCDFARNVLCKKPGVDATTKAPVTKAPVTTASTTTTTRKPIKLSTKSSLSFRSTTTTTTPEPEEEEYEEDVSDAADIDAEDPKVIKELIDLIKKVGGVEQLEKHLHLADSSLSTDGTVTTTSSPYHKKLYQKVLERTRGKTLNSNTVLDRDSTSQNSRRGPQNAGLEAAADKDKTFRKDRPQYTTINRSRPPPSTQKPAEEIIEEDEDSDEEEVSPSPKPRAVQEARVGTTSRPLQYVNIRRARPSTSDTADDTASRNALFERPEAYVSVAETPNSLDIGSARRDNLPEYVTIRRQRPTTEETTTLQYQTQTSVREAETQATALEREISSSQPQYTSILRVRSTTLAPEELTRPEEPEPTTILAVQISSLLNSPESQEPETVEPETEPPTTSTTTTTTTQAPTTRRNVLRRRGTTTTTTASPTSTSTAQAGKRPSFLRRTKPTSAPGPDAAETEAVTAVETTTGKISRRPASKFKSRKEIQEAARDAGKESKRPSLRSGAVRTDKPTAPARNFVRRRGASVTYSTTTTSTTAQPALVSRRPFRVASRRRPLSSAAQTTTKLTTVDVTTTETTRSFTVSGEEVEDSDVIEDPALQERPASKTPKLQRRPLVLKHDDQKQSATNEEERKRQNKALSEERKSKKYHASINKNQLDEVIKRAKSSEEVDVTTSGTWTTIEDFSAETALAIAAHQLISAPLPIETNYDENGSKTTKKPSNRPKNNPELTTEYEDYSTTPIYRTTPISTTFNSRTSPVSTTYISRTPISTTTYSASQISTTSDSRTDPVSTTFNSRSASKTSATSTVTKSTPYAIPVRKVSKPSGFTTASVLNSNTFGQSTISPAYSRVSQSPSLGPGFDLGPSTARYLGINGKPIPVPVEDYSLSPGSNLGEPSFFTREYLLESPVTKTYDDEYQYLSPVTTPQTTRKPIRKTVYRKISTTLSPTPPSIGTPRPRVATRKPFEKIPKLPNFPNDHIDPVSKIKHTYRPVDNYDYYDDGDARIGNKYEEGTKVVLHGTKGTIECLDMGNFPHPSSCKKFISCARIDNGSILGWEYICPKGLSFDPVGGICNWSAGLGCHEQDL